MVKHHTVLIIILIFITSFWNCSTNPSNGHESDFEYFIPEFNQDGLHVGHLNDVGMNVDRIVDLGNIILNGGYYGVDSVLIIKDGLLVLEAYFGDWSRDSVHDIMSCTKSVISAVLGIAIDQGYLKGTTDLLFGFIHEYGYLQTSSNKDICISHLLRMTAGFDWDQSPPFDRHNNLIQMVNATDSIEYVLRQPIVSSPGQEWRYNGGCTQLLAEIIRNVTGMEANIYADLSLFRPLGITQYYWNRMVDGRPNADYGLHLRSRDMAKIGLLFLNNGLWQGRKVISEEWIRRSTAGYEKPLGKYHYTGYGYQWWVNNLYTAEYGFEHYSAVGNGGQYIIVFPALDMVVVFTQHYYEETDKAWSMLNNYILAALPLQYNF